MSTSFFKYPATVRLILPWPPSVDHYWRHVGTKVLLSAAGRRYKARVAEVVQLARERRELGSALCGRLEARLVYSAPDRRGWDADCYLKAPFDAMQDAGVYEDDRQIRRFSVEETAPGRGTVEVELRELGDDSKTGETDP